MKGGKNNVLVHIKINPLLHSVVAKCLFILIKRPIPQSFSSKKCAI